MDRAIQEATEYAFRVAIKQVGTTWGNRVARLPWTTEEVSQRVEARYEGDERRFIGALQTGGSVACRIYAELRLDRTLMKELMRRLHADRRHQAVLCGIVCASRFKFFEASKLLPVACQKCGSVDSLEHLLECTAMGEPPMERKALVEYLVRLTYKAAEGYTGRQERMRETAEVVEAVEEDGI